MRVEPSLDLLPGVKAYRIKQVQDNGVGAIAGGSINYATGEITDAAFVDPYTRDTWQVTRQTGVITDASWTTVDDVEALRYSGDNVEIEYCRADQSPSAGVTGSCGWNAVVEIDLLPGSRESLVPGTVRFVWGTERYSDRDGIDGTLYLDDGTVAGTMDYQHRKAYVAEWSNVSSGSITIESLVTTRGEYWIDDAQFRTASAPLAPGSLQVVALESSGDSITGDGDTDGVITGTGFESGTVEHDIGVVAVSFDEQVMPSTLVYSATAFTIVPLSPDIVGVDPTRLPPDGRVPIIRSGYYLALYEDGTTQLANPAVAGATYGVGQQYLAFAGLEDGAGEETEALPAGLLPDQVVALTRNGRTGPLEYCVLEDAKLRPVDGALYHSDLNAWTVALPSDFSADGYDEPFSARFLALVAAEDYEVDRDAGEVLMADPLDLTGYTQPLVARWRIHDLALCVEAQTTGAITLQSGGDPPGVIHDYSTAGAVSAMLLHGDLVARVANEFEQNTDAGSWADYLQGDAPSSGARYDWTGYPVQVQNNGAIRERWRVRRRSDGLWDVIGESLGVIQVWDGQGDLEARRSASQPVPYWVLFSAGLGAGWATGNFLQFETWSTHGPFWIARTTQPGRATVATDAFRIRHRVGAD